MGLFRGRCGDCHGIDATGVRGPDITQVWASGRTDEGLFKTIRNGVPGTEMPANPRVTDPEIWQILAFLRTIASAPSAAASRGIAANGEKTFKTMCASCHRVNGSAVVPGQTCREWIGALQGDDGAEDSRRHRGLGAGFEPVTLTPAGGQPIGRERTRICSRADHGRASGSKASRRTSWRASRTARGRPCARLRARLSDPELDDLRYLQTLRGFDPPFVSRRLACASSPERPSRPRPGSSPRPAGGTASASPLVSAQEIAKACRRRIAMGDLRRQLRQPSPQSLDPDHPANVNRLVPKWTFQTGVIGNFETTSLLRDNVLHVTGPLNVAGPSTRGRAGRSALSPRAARGASRPAAACQSRLQLLGDKLFMTTLDAHLLALDMRTGAPSGTRRSRSIRTATPPSRPSSPRAEVIGRG
jgi:mono/diheme cytochrome c family protein